MKKKILLIAGHGNGDVGAVGIDKVQEATLNREVVDKVGHYLNPYFDVSVYPKDRNAYADVQKGTLAVNFKDYDYVFEIHFNAFNGKAFGTECYVTTMENGIDVEQYLMKNMAQFFKLRDNDAIYDGVKRTNFSVITTAKNSGVSSALLEICFIDNASDMEIYKAKKEEICLAIADGLIDGFKLRDDVAPTPTPAPKPIPTPKPIPDQILTVGSKVVFKNMQVTGINIPKQLVNVPLMGGWVQSSILKEVGGNNAIDQVLNVGSVVTVSGTYSVTAIQGGTNNVKINHPSMTYWINANCLTEV